MDDITTTKLYQELSSCKVDEELLLFLNNYEKQQLNWKNYITEQMIIMGLSYEKFGNLCGFSKNTIKSWCNAGVVPKNRDHYIKLGFGLNMNEEEMNKLLTQYGGYPALYPKDVYDAICIYILHKREKNWEDERYQYPMLHRWYERYEQFRSNHKINKQYYIEEKTYDIHQKLLLMEEDEEFENFLKQHREVFQCSYSKLIAFLEEYICIRCHDLEEETGGKVSFHRLVKLTGLDDTFEVAYSKLRCHGMVPTRQQLISFGLSMNMTRRELDTMLELANMQTLYVRNRWDCIMIYLLRRFDEQYPSIALENAFKLEQLTSNPHWRNVYREVIQFFYSTDELENEDEELPISLKQFVEDKIDIFIAQ